MSKRVHHSYQCLNETVCSFTLKDEDSPLEVRVVGQDIPLMVDQAVK